MPSRDDGHDYECEFPGTNPPIGSNFAMHYLEHPDDASIDPIIFKQVPIKRQVRLKPCPTKGSSQGWGVQFIESANPFAVLGCGFIGFILCLVTSVWWTVARGDVQGGFGIGGFVLAFFIWCASQLHLIA